MLKLFHGGDVVQARQTAPHTAALAACGADVIMATGVTPVMPTEGEIIVPE